MEVLGGERHEESKESIEERMNPLLMDACMENDFDGVKSLIEKRASPICEDVRRWTPLTWAASHGNEGMVRYLVDMGAASPFAQSSSNSKGAKRVGRNTPLHWAAFKGHLRIVWLLLGQKLSPHEKDQIGNTVLHQAAAGGNIEVIKCLLGLGVDAFATNNRGHAPITLSSNTSTRDLLQRTMDAKACKASGKQFSSTVPRFMCQWTNDYFCHGAVKQLVVYADPDSTVPEKPTTLCVDIATKVSVADRAMASAIASRNLQDLESSLSIASQLPVDPRIFANCQKTFQILKKEKVVESCSRFIRPTDNLPWRSMEDWYLSAMEECRMALQEGRDGGASDAVIETGQRVLDRLAVEVRIDQALRSPPTSREYRVVELEELHARAVSLSADESLTKRAGIELRLMHSQSALTDVVSIANSVFEKVDSLSSLPKLLEDISSTGETTGETTVPIVNNNAQPIWLYKGELFTQFIEGFRNILTEACDAGVNEEETSGAKPILEKLELWLTERLALEEEARMKELKKSKKKKKSGAGASGSSVAKKKGK